MSGLDSGLADESAVVILNASAAAGAYYAVAYLCRVAPAAATPKMWKLKEQLDAARRNPMSRTRLRNRGEQQDCQCVERIGSRLAAEALGVTQRHVERLHADLDGHKDDGGRWSFNAAKVREYAAMKGQRQDD